MITVRKDVYFEGTKMFYRTKVYLFGYILIYKAIKFKQYI